MKIFNLILVLCLTVCLASCQKQPQNTLRTLTLNLQEGDPPSLNPYVGVDLRSRCLYLNLFEPLMRRQADGSLEYAAASHVDIDPSQTIYTFTIRPHRWSNGEEVTSHHFENAWKYALTPLSRCYRADLFYPIKNAEKIKKGELPLAALGVTCLDNQTLKIELEHPTPYFLDLTASSFFSPLFHAGDEEPSCFNGPYTVDIKIPEQKLILKQNPYYWDKASLDYEQICFTMVRDPMTALAMFEKKELDLVGDPFSALPLEAIPSVENSGHLHHRLISRIFYLLINNTTYPLDNRNLRRALALSLDRKQIAEHLFLGETPTCSLLPRTLSSLEETVFECSDELALAYFEKALEELNITRETFPKIVFSYAELSGQKRLAEFVKEEWKKKLGIDIDIVCSEWNVHIHNLRNGKYTMGTLHLTTLYQDPMFYFDLFRERDSLCNYCHWEHPDFQNLIKELEQTTDNQRRKELLQEAELCLFEHMPAIALFTQNLQYLMQDHVKMAITDLGIYDFKTSKSIMQPLMSYK